LLQNDTDPQTEITTHCPITFIRLQSITKVEKKIPSVFGRGNCHLWEIFPLEDV